jgi:hypothetical protein
MPWVTSSGSLIAESCRCETGAEARQPGASKRGCVPHPIPWTPDAHFVDRLHERAVGGPQHVRRVGDDRAVVRVRIALRRAVRRQEAVLAHQSHHALTRHADLLLDGEPRPDRAMPLADKEALREVLLDHREQRIVVDARGGTAPAGLVGGPFGALPITSRVEAGTRRAENFARAPEAVRPVRRRRLQRAQRFHLLMPKGSPRHRVAFRRCPRTLK